MSINESDMLRSEIEYALSEKKYEGRLISVFVGPTAEMGRDIPWILTKYSYRQIQSFDEGVA